MAFPAILLGLYWVPSANRCGAYSLKSNVGHTRIPFSNRRFSSRPSNRCGALSALSPMKRLIRKSRAVIFVSSNGRSVRRILGRIRRRVYTDFAGGSSRDTEDDQKCQLSVGVSVSWDNCVPIHQMGMSYSVILRRGAKQSISVSP